MNSSSSRLIFSVISSTSRERTASRSRSMKTSVIAWVVLIRISLEGLARSFLFEIGVAREAFLVAPEELARLLQGHALGPQGRLRRLPDLRHQVVAAVAHVRSEEHTSELQSPMY